MKAPTTTFTCSLQPLDGDGQVARIHAGAGGYGDPVLWSCTVDIIGTTAYLYAADKPLTYTQAKALFRELLAAGAKVCRWERKDSAAKLGWHKWDLTKIKGL